MSLLVGLDIGTGGGRCLLVDEGGREIASASRPWRYGTGGDGFAVLPPSEAYATLASVTKEALASADPAQVVGVGVTSQRTGMVLVDETGAEVHAGPNADGRGGAIGLRLEREHGEVVYRIAGRLPLMIYAPARLAWFRENRPDVLERARWALSWSDWLAFRLTGEAGTEPTQAAETALFDVAAGAWSEDLCARLAVDPALLPPVRAQGTRLGALREDAARDFGIPAGAGVTGGGADTQCGTLGLGCVAPGQAAVVSGSTMICDEVTSGPVADPERRLWTSPHAMPGGFVVEAHCGEAGTSVDWFTRLLGVDHAWMDEAAAGAPPGAGGVCFLDAAPNHAADFTLVRTGGLTFPVPVLALGRSREDVARAVLEGIAFAATGGLRWLFEVGGAPSEVAVGGGMARMPSFVRILAAALARPVRRARGANASALGAAILAAAGSGAHADVASAVAAMSDRGEIVEPDTEWIEPTKAAYATWRERMDRVEDAALRVSRLGDA